MDKFFKEHGRLLTARNHVKVGVCAIEISKGKPRRMYADQIMREILGIQVPCTPEDCYRTWEKGIPSTYTDCVESKLQEMTRGSNTEFTFPWINSEQKMNYFCFRGELDRECSEYIRLYGYQQNMTDPFFSQKEPSCVQRLYDNILSTFGKMFVGIYIINTENNEVLPLRNTINCGITEGRILEIREYLNLIENFLGKKDRDILEKIIVTGDISSYIQRDPQIYSPYYVEIPSQTKDWMDIIISRVSIFSESDTVIAFRHIGALKTEFEKAQARITELKEEAVLDTLTQIQNRRYFQKKVEKYLESQFETKNPCAFLMIDLDNFKNVNDTLGHIHGDMVLIQTAEILKKNSRAGDETARLGGDEFAIFLKNINSRDDVECFCNRIKDKLVRNYSDGKTTVSVSVSIGCAIFPQDGTDFCTLYSHADKALYQAKSFGKNTYQFYQCVLNP